MNNLQSDFRPVGETTTDGAEGIFELADRLVELRARKDNLAAETKDVNRQIETLTEEMSERMLDAELSNFNRGGARFTLATKTLVNAIAARREELIEELAENGHMDMIKNDVNSQTLGAFVRELLEDDDELPAWIADKVRVYPKREIRITKT